MCFSLEASAIAAGVLITAGAIAVAHAKSWPMRAYAAVPLLFGVQQAFEAWQWYAVGQGTTCQTAGYGFLFFAFLVWPVLLPGVAALLEKDRVKREVLRGFLVLGIFLSLGLLVVLLTQPLHIVITQHQILYDIAVPALPLSLVFYVIAVSGAPMCSSRWTVKMVGLLSLLGFMVSWVFFLQALASVWCFFAAIISVIIVFDVVRSSRR